MDDFIRPQSFKYYNLLFSEEDINVLWAQASSYICKRQGPKISLAYNELTYKKTKDEYELEDSFQAGTGQFLIKRRLKERI